MKFATIVADPPWEYRNTGVNGAAAKHYQTMPIRDILDLPVAEVAGRDAVLLLWATWPLLPEALQVMDAWGFTYKSGFPWVKIDGGVQATFDGTLAFEPVYGLGVWVRGCSELVLIGARGKARAPRNNYLGLLCDNAIHSRKPAHIYAYADTLPGPYLELFGRRPREGWTVLGNEIDGQNIRDALQHLTEVPVPLNS